MGNKTIIEKIWHDHTIMSLNKQNDVLLYIDLHLLHEINTPPAFDGLRERNIGVYRIDKTLSTEDHNTPTLLNDKTSKDIKVWDQIFHLRKNCEEFGIKHNNLGSDGQGITHVIAPEQGRILPGMTVVCCDSHTTTHGAFGALAFGIGTSQVEHVLATQTLRSTPFKTLCIDIDGVLPTNVTAKDLALFVIRKLGTGGGIGYVIEYRGETISSLSMEQRMTLCNMSVEAGASAGIISPDSVTVDYLLQVGSKNNLYFSKETIQKWLSYASDKDAKFDKYIKLNASEVRPMISWGTNPSQTISIGEKIPYLHDIQSSDKRFAAAQALHYMGLNEGQSLHGIPISTVFIGSCTNGRIEDLRIVANLLKRMKVNKNVHLLIVPGSMSVYRQAIIEGLDKIFEKAGADFRQLSGCSLCVGLNSDRLDSGVRTVSTSNRNFEGRQGKGVRTHIASPIIATLSAVKGYIVADVDCLESMLHV